jgi:hypothetical protein
MNVWLVTTGSSDVQLTSDENWSDWWQETKKSLYRLQFEPVRPIDDEGEPYRLPARVLGIVHDRLPDQVQPYLSFPLLQNFIQKLKTEGIHIDKIIVLITDQENIFPESERETKRCPYWQDTCQLYPILENYLSKHFPDATVKPLIFKPSSPKLGLDNWDAVLELVQRELADLKLETEPQNVYVSHQAGTPAISSAVQFCSLARFGDRVKFLVSNEYNPTLPEQPLEGSSYLRGIRIQEAKALLDSHNYAGVKDLLDAYLEDEEHKEIKILLDASIQWNFAKFDEFANELQKLSDQDLVQVVKERSQQWWWIAYEAAYLAFIRLDQKNAVEAFFHSFRAVEGLISRWTEVTYPAHVDSNNDSPQVKLSILEELPDYLSNKKQKHLLSEFKEKQKLGLHSFPLYDLLRKGKPDWRQKCKDLSVFTDQIAPKRNKLFHRLKGLEVSDVFQEWKVNDLEELEVRIRHYLNFISNQSFNSLKTASLMAKVHRELVEAIAHL